MKASMVAASAALVGAVAATHNAHGAFHLRRGYPAQEEVCTVYTTVYVYPSEIPTPVANSTMSIYPTPEESSAESTPCPESTTEVPPPPPPPPPATTEESYPSTKEIYTPAPPPPPAPTKESEPSKAYTPEPSSEKPSSSKMQDQPKPTPGKTPSEGGHSNGGRIVTNGNKWAMTYTPYTSDGQCKSESDVQTDIAKIADLGFTTIRVYSTDCGVFEHVVPACKTHNLKIIYGIFFDKAKGGPGSPYANEQLDAIIKNTPPTTIAMLVVGNESMFNEICSASDLAAYILYVKKALKEAGFPSDVPVTTTEPVGTWEQKGAALCDAIDVFAVQVHPFFTATVSASDAGKFAKQQLEQAAKVCPEAAARGKYITEIGWPTEGTANGAAHPGKSEQKNAIESILETVGAEACLFSYANDKWKAPGEYGVEQSWGCADAL